MADYPQGSDRLSVAVGIENWRDGETTLSVDAQGRAEVRNRRAGRETQFDGNLTVEQANDLSTAVGAMANLQRENKARKPDDVPLKVSWSTAGTVVGGNQSFWYGDRYSIPEVNQVIRLFNQYVKQISNGAIST